MELKMKHLMTVEDTGGKQMGLTESTLGLPVLGEGVTSDSFQCDGKV